MGIEVPSSSELLLCTGAGLRDRTIPQTDVKGTVLAGIFANNTLDFAKTGAAARTHFALPEENSCKDNSCI